MVADVLQEVQPPLLQEFYKMLTFLGAGRFDFLRNSPYGRFKHVVRQLADAAKRSLTIHTSQSREVSKWMGPLFRRQLSC